MGNTRNRSTRVLSLKLPSSLDAKLTATAKSRGVSKSSLVRLAIEALLEDETVASESFAAQAADLAGAVSGPADLSYNKSHLNNYGK
jgi:predicted DNA-binding protein